MVLGLNALDLVLLGVLAIATIVGALRGVSRMVFSWILWIGVLYFLYNYYHTLAHLPILDQSIGNEFLQIFAVFSVGIVCTFIVSAIVQIMLGRAISVLGLVVVDKFLGLYLGMIQGVLLVGLLVLSFARTSISDEQWWKQSKVVSITTYYAPIYTKGYVELIENATQKLDENLVPLMQVQDFMS